MCFFVLQLFNQSCLTSSFLVNPSKIKRFWTKNGLRESLVASLLFFRPSRRKKKRCLRCRQWQLACQLHTLQHRQITAIIDWTIRGQAIKVGKVVWKKWESGFKWVIKTLKFGVDWSFKEEKIATNGWKKCKSLILWMGGTGTTLNKARSSRPIVTDSQRFR